MKKTQVLCISTASYLPFPSRKQNVMERLPGAEVLYFDPPVSLIAPLKDPKAKEKLNTWREEGVAVRENITVYGAPPVWPFFNKHRWINRRNQKRFARYVRQRMREQGFEKPLLWCYSPTSCDLADLIPNCGVVYDCVDRHSAYPGHIDPAVVDRMEEDLARRCTQVFCTAEGLYDTLIQYNEHTELIPNGVNYPLFSQAAGRRTEPGGPVFGFVGMLQECIDQDCLLAVAKAFPEGELRIIGRSLPGVDLSRLQAQPNVKFLGLMPQTELPAQIRQFDVCLNPFRGNALSKDVSPLKFYEYLATGKPLVSTPEPRQVRDFGALVQICEGPEAFAEGCRRALAEAEGPDGPALEKARMEAGRACSWDSRVAQMVKTLAERGIRFEG